MAVALLSQILGAAQLLVLLRVAGASTPVDTYLVAFSVTQAPTAIAVLGIFYPMQLAHRREGTWDREHVWAALAGGSAGFLALGLTSLQQGVETAIPVTVPLIVAGALGAAAGVSAVGLACAGRGEALVGLAILPNSAALLALSLSQNAPPLTATYRMAIALALGNLLSLLAYRRQWTRASARLSTPHNGQQLGALSWLAAGSIVGYSGGLLLQSATGALDEGDATVWGVTARAAGLVTFVGVTAVVPSLLNWTRAPGPRLQHHVSTALLVGSAMSVLVYLVMANVTLSGRLATASGLAPLVVCWITAAGVNSLVTKSAERVGRMTAYRTSTLYTAPIYILGATILSITGDLRVGVLTIVAAASTGNLCMLAALEWRRPQLPVVLLLVVAFLTALID